MLVDYSLVYMGADLDKDPDWLHLAFWIQIHNSQIDHLPFMHTWKFESVFIASLLRTLPVGL